MADHGAVSEPQVDISPLRILSYPLMPTDPARRGSIVEAPVDWRIDPSSFDPEAEVIVWGRTSDRSVPLRLAVRWAAAREAALRTMRHRAPPPLRRVAV